MMLDSIDLIVRRLGGGLVFVTLGIILFGVWRGTQRQVGKITGKSGPWMRSSLFYLITTIIFVYLAYLGWTPLPWILPSCSRAWVLIIGSIMFFPGIVMVLWGRLTLGKNYFVSTGLGAQVFQDQQLVTHGPYRFVRHPMYFGIILASIGSLLMYWNWTTFYFMVFSPAMIRRARLEDITLAAEFGEHWLEYRKNVPGFIPKILRKKKPNNITY